LIVVDKKEVVGDGCSITLNSSLIILTLMAVLVAVLPLPLSFGYY
jgi:hypothetical protein